MRRKCVLLKGIHWEDLDITRYTQSEQSSINQILSTGRKKLASTVKYSSDFANCTHLWAYLI